MDKTCVLVQELLPLYVDGACTAEGAAVVAEHLGSCPACRTVWQEMCAPLPQAEPLSENSGAASAPEAPFEKVKRHYVWHTVKALVLTALGMWFILLAANDLIGGDGFSLRCFPAWWRARGAVQAVVERDEAAIARRLAFSGEVPEALEKLAAEGVVITGGRAVLSETYLEDMFLLLTVEFEVQADGQCWTVPFTGTCRSGRVELMYIDPGWPGWDAERPTWADALEQALYTYDPG